MMKADYLKSLFLCAYFNRIAQDFDLGNPCE